MGSSNINKKVGNIKEESIESSTPSPIQSGNNPLGEFSIKVQ